MAEECRRKQCGTVSDLVSPGTDWDAVITIGSSRTLIMQRIELLMVGRMVWLLALLCFARAIAMAGWTSWDLLLFSRVRIGRWKCSGTLC